MTLYAVGMAAFRKRRDSRALAAWGLEALRAQCYMRKGREMSHAVGTAAAFRKTRRDLELRQRGASDVTEIGYIRKWRRRKCKHLRRFRM